MSALTTQPWKTFSQNYFDLVERKEELVSALSKFEDVSHGAGDWMPQFTMHNFSVTKFNPKRTETFLLNVWLGYSDQDAEPGEKLTSVVTLVASDQDLLTDIGSLEYYVARYYNDFRFLSAKEKSGTSNSDDSLIDALLFIQEHGFKDSIDSKFVDDEAEALNGWFNAEHNHEFSDLLMLTEKPRWMLTFKNDYFDRVTRKIAMAELFTPENDISCSNDMMPLINLHKLMVNMWDGGDEDEKESRTFHLAVYVGYCEDVPVYGQRLMSNVSILDEDFMWVVDIGSAELVVSELYGEKGFLKVQEAAGEGNHDDSVIDAIKFIQSNKPNSGHEKLLLEQSLESELDFEFTEITPTV